MYSGSVTDGVRASLHSMFRELTSDKLFYFYVKSLKTSSQVSGCCVYEVRPALYRDIIVYFTDILSHILKYILQRSNIFDA